MDFAVIRFLFLDYDSIVDELDLHLIVDILITLNFINVCSQLQIKPKLLQN